MPSFTGEVLGDEKKIEGGWLDNGGDNRPGTTMWEGLRTWAGPRGSEVRGAVTAALQTAERRALRFFHSTADEEITPGHRFGVGGGAPWFFPLWSYLHPTTSNGRAAITSMSLV